MSKPGTPLTDSRLAALCAETARDAFQQYERRFDEITARAHERFQARDWQGSNADARERLQLYSRVLDCLTKDVRGLMGERLGKHSLWIAIKAVYSSLIAQSVRWEIAESFFNSLTRRVFVTEGIDQAIEFLDTDFDAPPTVPETELTLRLAGLPLPDLLNAGLTSKEELASEQWADLAADVAAARERLRSESLDPAGLELARAIFYRGRGAYLVGRLCLPNDKRPLPVAFCLRHPGKEGVRLDAVLVGEADLAILFSYTRAYFRVEVPSAFQLVRWLRELMPGKRLADLYNAIGFNRHAKTEFYRDFVRHLDRSHDCFVAAEGARGMVMLVFTLPSYDVVFKLIRDHFDAPKESDRREVMARYHLVFEHDRAGRLVEAHEFEHLRIDRQRFDQALLAELLRDAVATVRLDGEDVLIRHAYVERRVRPLNLFFHEADEGSAIDAACDYGQAIKDLAASNIFTGDLLTKNFGLTRRGRVVFYDYDELGLITDCNFRALPEARSYEEEIAAEPWFSVRESDIFPEEFPRFLSFPEPARRALVARHGDLFRPEFWREIQARLRAGELPEILPYAEERRLTDRAG